MPIKLPNNLPAVDALERENIFVMEGERAANQDIRPLRVGILNLMPNKIETEIQILRLLSNTPLQVEIVLIRFDHMVSKTTPAQHMNAFYQNFSDVESLKFDGLVITGAPLAFVEYDQVTYWQDMQRVMQWTIKNVQSTMYLCWAAHAALYQFYGLKRTLMPAKLSGVFRHRVVNPHNELVRGFDPEFWAPHSRFGTVLTTDYERTEALHVLAQSPDAGVYLASSVDKKRVFITGHPEYDAHTLDQEYQRDLAAGESPALPQHYYPNDDPTQAPMQRWKSHGNLLFTNWLNYYVYQMTPYDLSLINE